jgi:hypothetical protein
MKLALTIRHSLAAPEVAKGGSFGFRHFFLCSHCLSQIAQFFVHVLRVNHCASDFIAQNRTIARTQTCHFNAQMCSGAA